MHSDRLDRSYAVPSNCLTVLLRLHAAFVADRRRTRNVINPNEVPNGRRLLSFLLPLLFALLALLFC